LRNFAIREDLVNGPIEIATVDVNLAIELATFRVGNRLNLLQLFKSPDLNYLPVAEMKMLNPLRFTRQDELSGPRIGFVAFFLRSSKSIDVRAVLRQKDEVAQIRHDEF